MQRSDMPTRYRSDPQRGTAELSLRPSLSVMTDPVHTTGCRDGASPTPTRLRRVGVLAVTALTMCLIAACGTSGRELRDPAPGATAPPRKAATSTTRNQVVADPDAAVIRPTGFALTAADWSPDGAIAARYGCAGEQVAPSLRVSGVPAGTAELLLIATDVAEPTVYRWIVAALPATTVEITADALPPGAFEMTNSTGSTSWAGPCPTSGSTVQFQLRLYALADPSGLTAASGPSAIAGVLPDAMQASVLRGTYTR